jgi:excisionase family DNA binding protein
MEPYKPDGHVMGKRRTATELIVGEPETYSVPEAGRIVGLGKNASYDAAHRGQLPILKFGRKMRVPRAALDRMLGKTVRGERQPWLHDNEC